MRDYVKGLGKAKVHNLLCASLALFKPVMAIPTSPFLVWKRLLWWSDPSSSQGKAADQPVVACVLFLLHLKDVCDTAFLQSWESSPRHHDLLNIAMTASQWHQPALGCNPTGRTNLCLYKWLSDPSALLSCRCSLTPTDPASFEDKPYLWKLRQRSHQLHPLFPCH